MSTTLVESYPEAAAVFQQADDVLGFSIAEICGHDSKSQLADTAITQLAIYVTSYAAWRVLSVPLQQGHEITGAAGHSLGEYTALAAAEAFSFEDGLRLVRARGESMRSAGVEAPGGLLAIIGADLAAIEVVCAELRVDETTYVDIANDNCPGQVVVGGTLVGIARLEALIKEQRLGRTVRLRVGVAPHTELMKPAVEPLRAQLRSVSVHAPIWPVVGNCDAEWMDSPDRISRELERQLTSRVRWHAGMMKMRSMGADCIVEVGPGKTLSGIMQRIDPSVPKLNFSGGEFSPVEAVERIATLVHGVTVT